MEKAEPPRPSTPSWFAADPSKAYYEKLSLVWAPISMLVLLVGVLGTPLYKYCDRNSYLLITVLACLPGIFIPAFFPCPADCGRPYAQRFWVKATVWIAIFGFYGNYFWTHYFYELLGAKYLFDSYRFNDVPLVTFTATFFYFTFYFNFVNLILRRVARFSATFPSFARNLIWWANIAALAYGTAVFEAVSIQHFPLYTYTETEAFMVVGSVVYGLYFVIGFPMFFSLDEGVAPRTSVRGAATNALAATAIVTLLLDLWRLMLGSIYEVGRSARIPVPFVYQGRECPEAPEGVAEVGSCSEQLTSCAEQASSWLYRKIMFSANLLQEKSTEVTRQYEHL